MQRAGSRRSPQKGRSVEMHHATYYRDHYRSNYSDNVYTQNVGIHPQPVSFNAYFSLESASFNDSTSAFNGDYEDFQNFTVENDFQDTKMQLPSLNSSFNSFNSCKMKTSRDFSHPAFDPSQERHRHSPPGRESFQQMEWENRKIRGMKYDVNEYLGYGDGQVNQHDRHVGKNVTEHHGSAENQDYSISLTAQADDSWGSWSSISDRSRLCWVHDDGESLPKYPLSPSPPPFRTPYSVAAVRPQHTRSHPDLFEQNERDGSCYGSSVRSCGLVNSRLWPPPLHLAPLPALDHLAAPRRWDDLADGYRPSTPELQTTFDVTLAGRPRPQSGPACHKQPTVGGVCRGSEVDVPCKAADAGRRGIPDRQRRRAGAPAAAAASPSSLLAYHRRRQRRCGGDAFKREGTAAAGDPRQRACPADKVGRGGDGARAGSAARRLRGDGARPA